MPEYFRGGAKRMYASALSGPKFRPRGAKSGRKQVLRGAHHGPIIRVPLDPEAEALHHHEHAVVGGEDLAVKPRDAAAACHLNEPAHQVLANAAPLPRIRDHDREFRRGGSGVWLA